MKNIYDLLDLAKEEIGYTEKDSGFELDGKTRNIGNGNHTKYGRDISNAGLNGYNGYAWGCSFQFWLDLITFGKKVALELWYMTDDTYVGYNTLSTLNVFKSQNKIGNAPKLGALIVFNHLHVGRVINYYDIEGVTYIECLEGDYSCNLNKPGMVVLKRIKANDASIKCYCYIDYDQFCIGDPTWIKDNDGWKYFLCYDRHVANSWFKDTDGALYWFDKTEHAIHDKWLDFAGYRYWFKSDCRMASSSWITFEGNRYYLTMYGSMAKDCYVKDVANNVYLYLDKFGVCDEKPVATLPPSAKVVV